MSPELGDIVSIAGGHTMLTAGWEPDSPLWKSLSFDSGNPPGMANEAALGRGAAEALGKKLGDGLTIHDRVVTVAGVFRHNTQMGNNMIIIPLATLQQMRVFR